jgi:translation initiation factor IF-2
VIIQYFEDGKKKQIASKRSQLMREQSGVHNVTLHWMKLVRIAKFKELNIILKGDVDGSVEALFILL